MDFNFRLFCCDYDETLATMGLVDPLSVEALERLKRSGRKVVLVTGRIMSELLEVFNNIQVFDLVVAENGGTLYNPITLDEKMLTTSPPAILVAALQKEKIPILVGRTIVASHVPFEKAILRVIQELGLEYQIIFNRGSLMILPSGVNKATGLKAALSELKIPARLTVGIGDGENDHAFLALCGYSAAVTNAIASLKAEVKWVTPSHSGAGVREFIERLLREVPHE